MQLLYNVRTSFSECALDAVDAFVGYHWLVCALPELCSNPLGGQRGAASVSATFSLYCGLKESIK